MGLQTHNTNLKLYQSKPQIHGSAGRTNGVLAKHSKKIFVELTSFDMAVATLDTNMISSISSSFTNTYNLQMYATEDRLILANNGYYYKKLNDGTPTLSEYTYRMTLNLSRAEAIPSPSRCLRSPYPYST